MREIKFRAKRIDNGEWVIGFYVEDEQGASILYQHPVDGSLSRERVIRETVGQYADINDCNENEIYEGDILYFGSFIKGAERNSMIEQVGEVAIGKGMVRFLGKAKQTRQDDSDLSRHICLLLAPEIYEVIGNIHDNPERLHQLD